jgi:hypothetical protein
MKKHFRFAAAVVVLGALGAIFGREAATLTGGAFTAAIAAGVLCVAYYRYRKVYPDDKTPVIALLEFLALVFIGALILYVVDALIRIAAS